MERNEILSYLKAMLHERFGIDPATMSGSTTQEQLGIDSLLMVDMMLDIETGLGFTFESMDMPRNPNLDAIVDMPALCRELADTMLAVRDDDGAQVFPIGGTRVLAYPAPHFAVADGGAAGRAAGAARPACRPATRVSTVSCT